MVCIIRHGHHHGLKEAATALLLHQCPRPRSPAPAHQRAPNNLCGCSRHCPPSRATACSRSSPQLRLPMPAILLALLLHPLPAVARALLTSLPKLTWVHCRGPNGLCGRPCLRLLPRTATAQPEFVPTFFLSAGVTVQRTQRCCPRSSRTLSCFPRVSRMLSLSCQGTSLVHRRRRGTSLLHGHCRGMPLLHGLL